ncbi:hypothetical protein MP638_007172 [Amoeboaphelidium occidentale]|nr:hypothetical protein MP638_007172 [Amoeboaphelidium occidentale]
MAEATTPAQTKAVLDAGSPLEIVLVNGMKSVGRLYSYDTKSNVVIIASLADNPSLPHEQPRHTFHVFKLDHVAKINPIQLPDKPQDAAVANLLKVLPSDLQLTSRSSNLNFNKLTQREHNAIKEIHKQLSRVNKNASSYGQDIFDALAKTLPCRWEGKDIIVMDEVRIKEPYEDCTVLEGKSGSTAVKHVSKVLKFEKDKLSSAKK